MLLRNELDYLDNAERQLLMQQAGIICHIRATSLSYQSRLRNAMEYLHAQGICQRIVGKGSYITLTHIHLQPTYIK